VPVLPVLPVPVLPVPVPVKLAHYPAPASSACVAAIGTHAGLRLL
jgi:hypothetical protein